MQLLLLAILSLAGAPVALGQVMHQYTNSTDSATNGISDTATPCSNRLLRTFAVADSFAVSDVNIGVLIAHTYRGDLVMYLVSPAGTRIELTAGANNNGADNFNAIFDDEAASAITTYTGAATATAGTVVPPYSNSFRPTAALSGFDGQNSAGTWTLEICDRFAQDSGTFYQADLFLGETPTSYADLSLAKSVSNAAPAFGDTITYTLTVANAAGSPLTASGVVVQDLLPAGISFVSAAGSGSFNSGTGLWSVGSLGPGANASLTITVTVTATAGATIVNYAEVVASSVTDLDSVPGNGSTTEDDDASASFTVSGSRVAGTPPVLSCPVGSSQHNWDSVAWTAGSTSNSYAVGAVGTIGFSIINPGAFLNNGAYGGQSPTRQNASTGGLSPAQYSLMQLVDLPSRADVVTTTITLPQAVPGLQFTVFDVDYANGQFADRITVTGTYNAAAVMPVLTNGVANYVIGNSAFGDAASSDTQSRGNVVVTFQSPVDTIVIAYGNHSLAPVNPGQQGVSIHDITFCNPQSGVTLAKVSSVIDDPLNGTTDPKALPGATIEYCVLITNTGSTTMTSVVATDPLPGTLTFIPGSLRSGSSCAGATTVEDDDNAGGDESDPFGASLSGNTISATSGSLAGSAAFAIKYRATVN